MTRHILITGSTRGIGAATAAAIGGHGRVVGHGTRSTDPDVLAADLSEPGAGKRLWQAALDRLDGRIDVLINNAGIYNPAPLAGSDAAWGTEWQRSLQVNLQAPADLCREAIAHFRSRAANETGERGRIINVASRASYRGDGPDHMNYAAAKAGLVGISKTIARAHAGEGIYCFTVTPGFVMTGMAEDYLSSRGGDKLLADIPLGRVATPDEVANAIVYLTVFAPASMTGAVLDINGASFVR